MHYNMVKRASRAYLEEIANRAHEMPEVYKCINTLQETAFTINIPVYQVMRTIHDKGVAIAGLPSHKIEEPTKPFDIATNEVASSGNDVPIATKLTDTILSSHSNNLAIL